MNAELCRTQLVQYKCATQQQYNRSCTVGSIKIIGACCIFLVNFISCTTTEDKKTDAIFEVLSTAKTGLNFNNKLHPDSSFNVLDYMYFYNGAGVGTGDFNNDGLTDLFFAASQSDNKIFLNEGHLHFRDVSRDAKIPQDNGWSTGVSVIDINNDGLLDLYVCRVGNFEKLQSHNQLLICKGIDKNAVPFFEDEAKNYGLDFSGFSTQAAFLDYDMDGDMDMFLMNHSVHQNGTFAERKFFLGTYQPLTGDKFYRNDAGKFTDVTKETGINSSAIGYGLGIIVSDIDLDGWPDIYIGNDFHENDYLYINQHNGTFREDLGNQMMHTSQYTMGVDAADINNDAYPDIISVDMLPSDPYMLKRSLGEDTYDIFAMKIKYGYGYQYTRNNLQLNRRNGMFSEVGLYADVFATDWSWSPLWIDFDNDGLKDLFVSNGIPKRLNDIDYVNYVSNDQVQEKMRQNKMDEKEMALINKFPEIKLPNAFYKNNGNAVFTDVQPQVTGNEKSFSNGAVYADLDNDGDLDIITNNIDDPVMLYQNKANDIQRKSFLKLKLKGTASNINAIGSKVIVYADSSIRTYEKYPVRGFLSAMEIPLHIGLQDAKIDSIILIWPDNTCQKLPSVKDTMIGLTYTSSLPVFDYALLKAVSRNTTNPMDDITGKTKLLYKHSENDFNEFDREQLMPQMLSEEGPALVVGDINKDGLEDIFIGGSKRNKGAVFLQQSGGTFIKSLQPDLAKDSVYEDVDASFIDVNNDGSTDLVIASGGNEYFGHDQHMQPRVYVSDGNAIFTRLDHAFDNIWLTASVIAPYDFNSDGYIDVFIGGRAVPWEYGKIPNSYLLQNDGKGHFKDVTTAYAKELATVGFVTSGNWVDMDKDGDKDLLISLQWGGLKLFVNDKGKLLAKDLTDKKGWWNFVLPYDIDNDGDIDLVAGNLGLNSRLKASPTEPVRLYYNDFDGNGKKEQVLTYYLHGKELEFANKDELQRQMPFLKKKYLYADDFAKAGFQDILPKDKLDKAELFIADYFSNAVLINNGGLKFDVQAMPWQAQLSCLKDAVIVNANSDNLPDILLVGNFYKNNIEMGRYDADYGTVLINRGKGSFAAKTINGVVLKGQSRHIRPIKIGQQQAYIVAKNNDSVMVIKYK